MAHEGFGMFCYIQVKLLCSPFYLFQLNSLTGPISMIPLNTVKSHNIQKACGRNVTLKDSLQIKQSIMMICDAFFFIIMNLSVTELLLEVLIA